MHDLTFSSDGLVAEHTYNFRTRLTNQVFNNIENIVSPVVDGVYASPVVVTPLVNGDVVRLNSLFGKHPEDIRDDIFFGNHIMYGRNFPEAGGWHIMHRLY